MKISHLPSSDWSKYRALRLESLQTSPQAFLSSVEETKQTSTEKWQKKLENMFFAINEKNQLLGMIGCLQEKKSKQNHIMKIVSLYVTPKFRGQGLGRELLKKALDFTKENKTISKVELGVVTSQKTAIDLYRSFGFTEIGIQRKALKIKDHYYDESLMELYLD